MVDYSKWKNIEISDDEDDTHPNIDTPSLFRWRHQARVERMADLEHEKLELEEQSRSHQARLMSAKEKLKNQQGDEATIKKELADLEKEGKELDRKREALEQKVRKAPWNVDTISKPGFQKTVLNKKTERHMDAAMTEEEREQQMKDFVKENEKLCKQYGMFRKYDDSMRFLQKHSHLVSELTANYLVIWCINLEMEEKHELMGHVAHQCICMQYILELGKQMDVDPRGCVSSFFVKIQDCAPEYRAQFEAEIQGFKERIQKRAAEKIREAAAEVEEEERQARLGPGGLDPAEVFEQLPEALQKCFESRDIELLQKTIAEMPVDQAKFYMKQCVDSGLWVPNAADLEREEKEAAAAAADKKDDDVKENKTKPAEEPVYSGVSSDDLD